eukprot:gene3971-biopygen1513
MSRGGCYLEMSLPVCFPDIMTILPAGSAASIQLDSGREHPPRDKSSSETVHCQESMCEILREVHAEALCAKAILQTEENVQWLDSGPVANTLLVTVHQNMDTVMVELMYAWCFLAGLRNRPWSAAIP